LRSQSGICSSIKGSRRSARQQHKQTPANPRTQPYTMSYVRIFPRRKAGEKGGQGPEKGRAPLCFDVAALEPLFALHQKDAASTLGISVTALKKVCRKLGIHSWTQVHDAKGGVCPSIYSSHTTPSPSSPSSPNATSPNATSTTTDDVGASPPSPLVQRTEETQVACWASCQDFAKPAKASSKCANSFTRHVLGAVQIHSLSCSPVPRDAPNDCMHDEDRTAAEQQACLVTPKEDDDALGHDFLASNDDLAFLVPLPSGFNEGPAGNWLAWYEEAARSFDYTP